MTDKKLMQQALNALEQVAEYFNVDSTETKTIIALRERLTQPDPVPYWHNEFLKHNTTSEQPAQQEPVAWITKNGKGWLRWHRSEDSDKNQDSIPLYTSPPASKPWVGLTQQDIDIAFDDTQEGGGFNEFARAIEAKLKEKNNG